MATTKTTDRKALSSIEALLPYLEDMNHRSSVFGLDPFCCETRRLLLKLKDHIEGKRVSAARG